MARSRATKPAGPSKAAAASKATAAAVRSETTAPTSGPRYMLEPSSSNPPRVLILPEAVIATDARVVTLPNPRSAAPARYLVCPETACFYELTRVEPASSGPRSWLLTPDGTQDKHEDTRATLAQSGDLFVATPIDPLFLVLPGLAASAAAKNEEGGRALFLSPEDHFDALPARADCAHHLGDILAEEGLRRRLEERMEAVCETVDAGGGETMFRLDEGKLGRLLAQKARALGCHEGGLPASMEDRFVKRALEAPLLTRRRAVVVAGVSSAGVDEIRSAESSQPSAEGSSQAAVVSQTTSAVAVAVGGPIASGSDDGGAPPVAPAVTASPEVVDMQRLRTAFDFICSRYLPAALSTRLRAELGRHVEFGPLDAYLADLAVARAEAVAGFAYSEASLKHGRDEDGGPGLGEDGRAEAKKRKAEEAKKKKGLESRGVRDLRKVNTSGMKKLTSFFKKKETT